MAKNKILITIISLISMSFSSNLKDIEFNYPKDKSATIVIKTNKFKKFKEEWRGEDYYYLSENGNDGLICSVKFYKLNNEEKEMLYEEPKRIQNTPEVSPIYLFTYFTRTKKHGKEVSEKLQNNKWGEPTDDFMFTQANVEIAGMTQKSMYAYSMFGKDLFVYIHLSKLMYTKDDSTAMRQILSSLQKKK
jgi:hypothetical protein